MCQCFAVLSLETCLLPRGKLSWTHSDTLVFEFLVVCFVSRRRWTVCRWRCRLGYGTVLSGWSRWLSVIAFIPSVWQNSVTWLIATSTPRKLIKRLVTSQTGEESQFNDPSSYLQWFLITFCYDFLRSVVETNVKWWSLSDCPSVSALSPESLNELGCNLCVRLYHNLFHARHEI
jgi:hypothetical protein